MANVEIKGSYSVDGEVNFETTLAPTTLIQIAVTTGVLLLFSLMKYLLPMVFSPFYMRRNRKFSIWFVDAFLQPISRFAKCGNVAAIFVLYQIMIIVLLIIMTIFGFTILVPVYLAGVDQSFNTDYRTPFSKMSLTHIEAGSYAILVPTGVATIYAFLMMEFYDQFHIVYIYFRQRALRRSAPQNFVIMLDQLPLDIKTYGDLTQSLENVFQDGVIRYIVPVPEGSAKLSIKYSKLISLIKSQHKANRLINYYNTELEKYMNKSGAYGQHSGVSTGADSAAIEKQINKLRNKIERSQKMLLPLQTKSRQLKLEILAYAHEMNIDLSHLQGISHLPPPMPSNVTAFNKLTTCTRMTAEDVATEMDNLEEEMNLPTLKVPGKPASNLFMSRSIDRIIQSQKEDTQEEAAGDLLPSVSTEPSNLLHQAIIRRNSSSSSNGNDRQRNASLASHSVEMCVNSLIGPLLSGASPDSFHGASRSSSVKAQGQVRHISYLGTVQYASSDTIRDKDTESMSSGGIRRYSAGGSRTDGMSSVLRPLSAVEQYKEQQATLGEKSTQSLRPVLTKYLLDIPKSVAEMIRTTFPDHGLGKIDAAIIKSKTRQQKRAHMDTPIGRTAFLIFNSQIEATFCANSLLYINAAEPRVGPAPEYNQILWGNTVQPKKFKLFMRMFFSLILLGLFVGYFMPQAYILNLVAKNGESWFSEFYKKMCKPGQGRYKCTENVSLTKGTVQEVGGVVCYICYKSASMSITLLPVIVQVTFMALLPLVIKYLTMMCLFTSNTEKANLEYRINFIFLILIVGIIQIMISSTFNESGSIDLSQFTNLTLNQLIANVGRNFPAQIFTFINYLITKYFLFSVLSLLRIPDLLLGLVKYIIIRDPIAKRRITYYTGFPYLKQLAYGSHMIVLGFMYSVVAPISSLFVCIIYFVFSIVNRFNILYVYRPLSDSEVSAATDIIKYVSGDTYLGFILMMVATIAFFIVLGEPITLACAYFLVAIMIIAIFRKIYVDSKFKKTMMTMHLSDWGAKNMCKINPYQEKHELIEADDGVVTYGEEKQLEDFLSNESANRWNDYRADISSMEVINTTRQKLSRIFGERMRVKPDINMNHLQKKELKPAQLNLAEPPVSYMRRTSIIFNDFQCEIANELSIQNHTLTDDEVRAIAAMYTHPAFALSYVYGPNRTDDDIR